MTGGRDARSEPRQPAEAPCGNQGGWICGTNEYSPGILGNTWNGELRWGEKAGVLACGMEFFPLDIQGKEYPECRQTRAQLDDAVVALTWEPRVLVLGYRGATAILAHAPGSRGAVGMPACRQPHPTRFGRRIGRAPVLPLHLCSQGACRSDAHTDPQSHSTGTRVSPSGTRDVLADSCFMSFQGFALKRTVFQGLPSLSSNFRNTPIHHRLLHSPPPGLPSSSPDPSKPFLCHTQSP